MPQENAWTLQKMLLWATDYLRGKGVENPRLDVELLLSHLLQKNRVHLYTHFDQPLTDLELKQFKILLQRRAKREPLAYILGKREFFGLEFVVSPEVLVPRPETELIVERGLEFLKQKSSPRILDLATGSGCILLALLKNLETAQGWGIDLSPESLKIAAQNAEKLGLQDRVQWLQQDLSQENWTACLTESLPFDLITANLPYVSLKDWQSLAPEVRDFEPKRALVPGEGESGTEAFLWILSGLNRLLAKDGMVLLEIGADQKESLTVLFQDSDWQMSFVQDYAELWRILELTRRV